MLYLFYFCFIVPNAKQCMNRVPQFIGHGYHHSVQEFILFLLSIKFLSLHSPQSHRHPPLLFWQVPLLWLHSSKISNVILRICNLNLYKWSRVINFAASCLSHLNLSMMLYVHPMCCLSLPSIPHCTSTSFFISAPYSGYPGCLQFLIATRKAIVFCELPFHLCSSLSDISFFFLGHFHFFGYR